MPPPFKPIKDLFMKPSKLYEALHALIGEPVPLHIWEPCGVGKSQIVGQVAAADLNYNFLDVRTVQLDRGSRRPGGSRRQRCGSTRERVSGHDRDQFGPGRSFVR